MKYRYLLKKGVFEVILVCHFLLFSFAVAKHIWFIYVYIYVYKRVCKTYNLNQKESKWSVLRVCVCVWEQRVCVCVCVNVLSHISILCVCDTFSVVFRFMFRRKECYVYEINKLYYVIISYCMIILLLSSLL